MTHPQAWDARLVEHLDEATIVAPLVADIAGGAIEIVKRFGFAIVESPATQLAAAAIGQRSDDLSDIEDRDDRGYRSGGELSPHSDPPTLILLHCLQPARSGGESSLVSVASIVERMRHTDSGLVDELFAPLPDWRVAGQGGIAQEGPAPKHRPVLTRRDGVLSCVLYRPYIERFADTIGPPLTKTQVAALDLFEKYSQSDQLTLRFVLQPGQTLVLHNRSVLHARTDFVDWPELERRRHLLRMWIDAPTTFPVHPDHELGDFFAPS